MLTRVTTWKEVVEVTPERLRSIIAGEFDAAYQAGVGVPPITLMAVFDVVPIPGAYDMVVTLRTAEQVASEVAYVQTKRPESTIVLFSLDEYAKRGHYRTSPPRRPKRDPG